MKKTTSYMCIGSLAVLILMSLMTGYTMSITTWLPSVTSNYQESVQTSNDLLPGPPVTTETPRLKGYIVYDCGDQNPGPCGSWSERMSGMFSAYVISVLLNKHFLIRYTRSCNLTDFLIPNSTDWRYNSSILAGRSWDYQNLVSKTPSAIKKNNLKSLHNLFTNDVNFVRMNWDYTNYFRYFENLPRVIPWVLELHFADIYLQFFNTLFKPTKVITEAVDKIVQNVTKLACAHISMEGSNTKIGGEKHRDKKQLKHVWNLLKTMTKNNYSIFVATDAQSVQNTAKELFKNLLETKGRIVNTDRHASGDGSVSAFRKTVLDFFVLTKCDVLILTNSGFGMMSAFLNNKNSTLYCLTPHEVLPCSRYTIHSFYPDEILSPV
ncbi:uncharacterized protein LOC110466771 [Mizuhopecten yessoensis]|uniref:Alpha-(1,6)-fucosyltransferase n=1 Tax=Mizuhopecten yessoensis TaxID=6573 RepID=A0A210R1Y7_MIZYE|nr:uncharacterized protein LOC110466771 [Mizuhopecten yessoensis]OWF54905.1 hypothetical protein KP79_PYT18022 [Mizuhopecten yessoensis]